MIPSLAIKRPFQNESEKRRGVLPHHAFPDTKGYGNDEDEQDNRKGDSAARLTLKGAEGKLVSGGALALEHDGAGASLCRDGQGLSVFALPGAVGLDDLVVRSAREREARTLSGSQCLGSVLGVRLESGLLLRLGLLDVEALVHDLAVEHLVSFGVIDKGEPAATRPAVFKRIAQGEPVFGFHDANGVALRAQNAKLARLGIGCQRDGHADHALVRGETLALFLRDLFDGEITADIHINFAHMKEQPPCTFGRVTTLPI